VWCARMSSGASWGSADRLHDDPKPVVPAADMAADMAAFRSRMKDLAQAVIEDMDSRGVTRFAARKAERAKVREGIRELEAEVAAFGEELGVVRGKVEAFGERVDAFSEKVDAFSEKVDAFSEKVIKLRKDLDDEIAAGRALAAVMGIFAPIAADMLCAQLRELALLAVSKLVAERFSGRTHHNTHALPLLVIYDETENESVLSSCEDAEGVKMLVSQLGLVVKEGTGRLRGRLHLVDVECALGDDERRVGAASAASRADRTGVDAAIDAVVARMTRVASCMSPDDVEGMLASVRPSFTLLRRVVYAPCMASSAETKATTDKILDSVERLETTLASAARAAWPPRSASSMSSSSSTSTATGSDVIGTVKHDERA
jgi:hypothetical protein